MSGSVLIGEVRRNVREVVRVALTEHRGRSEIDVRAYSPLNSMASALCATGRDVSLDLAQLRELRALIE